MWFMFWLFNWGKSNLFHYYVKQFGVGLKYLAPFLT